MLCVCGGRGVPANSRAGGIMTCMRHEGNLVQHNSIKSDARQFILGIRKHSTALEKCSLMIIASVPGKQQSLRNMVTLKLFSQYIKPLP